MTGFCLAFWGRLPGSRATRSARRTMGEAARVRVAGGSTATGPSRAANDRSARTSGCTTSFSVLLRCCPTGAGAPPNATRGDSDTPEHVRAQSSDQVAVQALLPFAFSAIKPGEVCTVEIETRSYIHFIEIGRTDRMQHWLTPGYSYICTCLCLSGHARSMITWWCW